MKSKSVYETLSLTLALLNFCLRCCLIMMKDSYSLTLNLQSSYKSNTTSSNAFHLVYLQQILKHIK